MEEYIKNMRVLWNKEYMKTNWSYFIIHTYKCLITGLAAVVFVLHLNDKAVVVKQSEFVFSSQKHFVISWIKFVVAVCDDVQKKMFICTPSID